MPSCAPKSLRHFIGSAAGTADAILYGAHGDLRVADLISGTVLGGARAALAGRSVLLLTRDQLSAAAALIELDGRARRIVLAPPDLAAPHIAEVVAQADIDAIVSDIEQSALPQPDLVPFFSCRLPVAPAPATPQESCATEWVLLTSGTTGSPKMVVHDLAGLTGAIKPVAADPSKVWATFYDMRRYGGLQIFLRAIVGGTSMVLSQAGEKTADHLARCAAHGVTHISGTPSHWRRALMSRDAGRIAPRYVRLSGEIADQAILDNLRETYTGADIGHAYASTEAGVGFEVTDGLEGFPARFVGATGGDVDMKAEDGSLRVRSSRAATRYVVDPGAALRDPDGFVDTGDMIERRGERYYFVGRRGGIINVGGLKVHPEEVEGIINLHAAVRMSLVRARRNPITGAIVVADVVLNDDMGDAAAERGAAVKKEILAICKEKLPAHKVPALLNFVASLAVNASGKLARAYG